MPRRMWAARESRQRFLIRTEQEEGLVRPLLHGQFAEHLGSCVYGGLWVGEDSPSFDAPDAISPKAHPVRIEAGKLLVGLPPLSVATVVVEIG